MYLINLQVPRLSTVNDLIINSQETSVNRLALIGESLIIMVNTSGMVNYWRPCGEYGEFMVNLW